MFMRKSYLAFDPPGSLVEVIKSRAVSVLPVVKKCTLRLPGCRGHFLAVDPWLCAAGFCRFCLFGCLAVMIDPFNSILDP
jgi:hypothetical protein